MLVSLISCNEEARNTKPVGRELGHAIKGCRPGDLPRVGVGSLQQQQGGGGGAPEVGRHRVHVDHLVHLVPLPHLHQGCHAGKCNRCTMGSSQMFIKVLCSEPQGWKSNSGLGFMFYNKICQRVYVAPHCAVNLHSSVLLVKYSKHNAVYTIFPHGVMMRYYGMNIVWWWDITVWILSDDEI